MRQAKVFLWSKVGCSYCEDVKKFFNEASISYEEIDVTNHDDRRDILEAKYGIRYVPVIEIGTDGNYTAVTDLKLDTLKRELQLQQLL